MNRFLRLIVVPAVALCAIAAYPKTKIACIGNSITYGLTLPDPGKQSYPSRLQDMLGKDYEVGNFGRSGATLLRKGHNPYLTSEEFRKALAFKPDVAVVHLGVNDTDPRNWPLHGDEFERDYSALIDSLRAVNPEVRIIVALLTPLRATHYRFKSGTRLWRLEIQEAIKRVAQAKNVELIDFDTPLRDRQNLLHDGIHPDAEGSELLARTAFSGITGRYGGLRLPPVYQSGMVLQRNRPLHIEGSADAGSAVTLTLDRHTYRTKADNRGRWAVTTAPLVSGKVYTLSVTDNTDTITLTDIAAGEVWVASGQSNMEFPLSMSHDGAKVIETCADTMLRIFNMRPIARTYDVVWPDSILDKMNRLQHFAPARWESIDSSNAPDFSAVAYHFARQLRDSLNVPVGVICNAVGGAPCEAWIDVNTLEEGMPEILLDWTGNDYIQKWAQERALKNLGGDKSARHPYEPSYLFASGVRPLGSPDIAGMIWYQGESNAHNTDIHERLFPMLADSWRRYFRNQQMPVYFAQLSSIDRPSWPAFRDSQRRLAKEMDGVGMAVTSDLGDSLDVHPTHKREVGQRLARQALNHTYGYRHVTPSGPQPEAAIAKGGAIVLTMANGDGLRSSDGLPLRTFEIAGTDGFYRTATAEITYDNKIKIYNMDISKPRLVRYGWQPFTRANLVNSDGLPASTFKIEVDNASDYDMEPGLEHGVSAPYATTDGPRIIMAGGCNFPTDPMAPDSRKKYYKGIYAADTATMEWRRIGSLPEGMAYGATATVAKGIVLIGGTTDTQSLPTVTLMHLEGDNVTLSPLPELPVALDNFAAAAIGGKVYVAGGNADGRPSTSLWMLDTEAPAPEWKKLKRMPGNPRVQPVMATGVAPSGEKCLYLWGGFAPRHDGKEPTLELDGLRYSPAGDKWEHIPGPADSSGNAVATGGGAACTLSDGRIAVAGGVNKDVFLGALRNQAPDYLMHPVEWYRFNPDIFIFDPSTMQWHIAAGTPDAARAGAAMVAGNNRDIYLTGGELKPRIRTSQTLHVTDL